MNRETLKATIVPKVVLSGSVNIPEWVKGPPGADGVPGKDGNPGVYIGTTEPTGDSLVWINPDGEATEHLVTYQEMVEYVAEQLGWVEIGTF